MGGPKPPVLPITPPGNRKLKTQNEKAKTAELLSFTFSSAGGGFSFKFSAFFICHGDRLVPAWIGPVGGLSQPRRDTVDPEETKNLKIKTQNCGKHLFCILSFTFSVPFRPRATEQS
jgi:hypothetical protein